MKNIPGIYKIINPKGKVYVGEAVNIKKRWEQYKWAGCPRQKKLHSSFEKYGIENHIFEIIEECSMNDLLCRERYWQDYYKVIEKMGLNLKLTECGCKKQVHSEETLMKMKGENNSQYGKKRPDVTERNKKTVAENHPFYGKKRGPSPRKGIERSEETKEKLRQKAIAWRKNNPQHGCLKIIDTETGKIYNSIKEAAKRLNINENTLKSYLSNKIPNKTTLKKTD